MPPKARITKNDIIGAGLKLVRRSGADSLSVRAVSAELGCSTQPIMYHYKTVGELCADIYAAADEYHSRFIMELGDGDEPLLALGLNYIRFAAQEKNLFRFLFQSDMFTNTDLPGLLSAGEAQPLLSMISEQSGLGGEQTRDMFETLFVCAHGLASLLANNSIEYDEAHSRKLMTDVFGSCLNYLK